MHKVTNPSVVIRQAPCGEGFGHMPLQSQLAALAKQGYRIVSVFPEANSYVIIGQLVSRRIPGPPRP